MTDLFERLAIRRHQALRRKVIPLARDVLAWGEDAIRSPTSTRQNDP